MQVPRLLLLEQVWQVLLQAVLQQTPSTQKPLAQSPAPRHAVPFCSCGTQALPAQWKPVVQSAFETHVVAHAVAPHMYAPHDASLTVWQTPAPLQVRAGVCVEPVHDSPTQVVPSIHRRHAPPPSQVPSWPQVEVASCMHSSSGSVPPMTGRQRPSAWVVLAPEQAMQPPPHAASQQTPSMQKPLAHSPAPPQAAPCTFSVTHAVPAQ
jgi:hypothetical protein